jgi:uncharacterized membrane-anchored protein
VGERARVIVVTAVVTVVVVVALFVIAWWVVNGFPWGGKGPTEVETTRA